MIALPLADAAPDATVLGAFALVLLGMAVFTIGVVVLVAVLVVRNIKAGRSRAAAPTHAAGVPADLQEN